VVGSAIGRVKVIVVRCVPFFLFPPLTIIMYFNRVMTTVLLPTDIEMGLRASFCVIRELRSSPVPSYE
jgi:hypothetical protein